MIWFWALVGALIGGLLEGEMLGFCLGAAVAVALHKTWELGRRLDAAERELETLRAERSRIPSPPAAPVAAPSVVATEREEYALGEASPSEPEESGPRQVDAAAASAAGEPFPATPAEAAATKRPSPAMVSRHEPVDEPAREPATGGSEPSLIDRGFSMVKSWFTEGNVPVKIGVVVLFAGVAAALRFAAAEGYLHLPIAWRLSLIAGAALVGLALGWRERRRRRTFALSLQGGAVGVLLLTIFAAFRLYQLLPAGVAFALVVVLVVGAALLAVLQQNMVLAVLGFLGGYLAPVLLSTGSGSHVALFSFYAVLNAAVLAIAWRQHWRLLNLVGFVFTFGVGAYWFSRSYEPEMFWSVEPFLILFFLFYVFIGLLFFIRPARDGGDDRRRPWLDGTLVFGTPLVAFPMQAVLLREQPMALAFSALFAAGVYLGLLLWLRRRRDERLLTEAYAALALGFATLAVPLAFSAATTASLWALEGAAIAWMGLRQKRTLPWLSGLALQPLAASAYLISEINRGGHHELLLLNGTWLGAAMLGFAGLALSLLHDRHKPRFFLPAVLAVWGVFWWTAAGITQLETAQRLFDGGGAWRFAVFYLASSVLAAGVLRRLLAWPRAAWGLPPWAFLALACVPWAAAEFSAVLSLPALPAWLSYLAALAVALGLNREGPGKSLALAHGLGLWTVTLLATVELGERLDDAGAVSGWMLPAVIAPTALLSLGLWRRPRWLAWPRSEAFESGYRWLWFGLALPLLALFWVGGLFDAGSAEPLTFLPLLNPLELGLVGVGALLWGFSRHRLPAVAKLVPLWAAMAFALISSATLRAVHHLHGESWSSRIFDSGFAQTSLTVVWSLLGVAAWIAGSRWLKRPLWLTGAGLMGVVLLKLIVVDRHFMGNIPGIISFLAVGLLLVAVGYFAPSPPGAEESS